MDLFGCAFGDCMPKQTSPCGVHFDQVFLDAEGNLNELKMDKVINSILGLLNWINDTAGMDEFCHTRIEEKFQECLATWKEDGHTDVELADF
jgi:hypothetical protein